MSNQQNTSQTADLQRLKKFNFEKNQPSFAGRFWYHFFPLRRKVVLENMTRVFGDHLSFSEIKKLAQRYYGHMWTLILENFTSTLMGPEEIKARVKIIGIEKVFKASEKKKGIIFLTGHFGNWEFAPVGAGYHFRDFKGRIHAVRKLFQIKFFEKVLFRRYYKAGLNIIPKGKNSLSQVLEALANNDVVVFIMDQFARPDRDGILVEFFGKKVGTFKSLSLIARETGAAVLPMASYRESMGHHVLKFSDPLEWIEDPDPDTELYENTRQYNRIIEDMILEHPDQWIWAHRRWKVKSSN